MLMQENGKSTQLFERKIFAVSMELAHDERNKT